MSTYVPATFVPSNTTDYTVTSGSRDSNYLPVNVVTSATTEWRSMGLSFDALGAPTVYPIPTFSITGPTTTQNVLLADYITVEYNTAIDASEFIFDMGNLVTANIAVIIQFDNNDFADVVKITDATGTLNFNVVPHTGGSLVKKVTVAYERVLEGPYGTGMFNGRQAVMNTIQAVVAPALATATFNSTIQTQIDIEDGSTFVEAVDSTATIDCNIAFKADLNSIFASVRMPDAKSNEAGQTTQDYHDFSTEDVTTLRNLFVAAVTDTSWSSSSFGALATYQDTYLEQVKRQLRNLFDNMSIDTPDGEVAIGSGVVRLKESTCVEFVTDPEKAQTLAAQTFIASQLQQLCEASARDSMRYKLDVENTDVHRLNLRPGDAWTVRVLVRAKGAAADTFTNTQVWAISIEQI
jgi:hypothetical protein